MKFTCIKCEFKFHETEMDTDERMCYDCLEEEYTEPTTADEFNDGITWVSPNDPGDENDLNKVQDHGPPYSMANPSGEPVSESLKIEDYDIATVEYLHDCLIEKEGYSLKHPMLKRSRELTAKLHKIANSSVKDHPLGAGFAHKDTKKGIQNDPEC